VEIDAASHTGVDNIREEILDKALYPPTSLKKKIYIIDEVHMLSKGAFNSLLKTIEEPKGNVCFILATTEIHKVPDTIVSRCQVFNFKKVSEEEIANHLASICDKEGFSYEKPALELIANISDGGVRDAVKYLDQVSILGNITQENASRFLGISSEATIKDFLDTLKKGERNQIFQAIDTINTNGIDLHQFAKQILGFIDKHLLEDTDFYLQISEAFSPILRQIRYYPYPAVIYKIALAPFASGTNDIPTPRIENPTKSKEEENPIIVLPVREKDPVVQQEEEGLPTTNKEEGVSNDLPTLRTTLTAKLSKPTVQSNLKDHVIIEKIENGTAHLVVTNKIAEMLLQNADNKKEIETLLSTEL
jgi:DNA polymerase III gamma/tau subunit